MLVRRPLTTLQKSLMLLAGMVAAAAMVAAGFPEPPYEIGKVKLLLLLWVACAVVWGVLVLIFDALVKAQKPENTCTKEGQNRRA